MPRAEKSLRTTCADAGGPLAVLPRPSASCRDIAATLADLDGRVVHRDLKPENVLLLDGRWCLADFGISRYAEATTAPDTRKYSMSAFRMRHRNSGASSGLSTPADVYAFGIMAYELLSGSLPFAGPDFRDQHLNGVPPPLTAAPACLGGPGRGVPLQGCRSPADAGQYPGPAGSRSSGAVRRTGPAPAGQPRQRRPPKRDRSPSLCPPV